MKASEFFSQKEREQIARTFGINLDSIEVHDQNRTSTGWKIDQENIAVNLTSNWRRNTVAHEVGHIASFKMTEVKARRFEQIILTAAHRSEMEWAFQSASKRNHRMAENIAIYFAKRFGVSPESLTQELYEIIA